MPEVSLQVLQFVIGLVTLGASAVAVYVGLRMRADMAELKLSLFEKAQEREERLRSWTAEREEKLRTWVEAKLNYQRGANLP